MENIIGFATSFYTLWNKQEEPVYFTDSYGKHWLQNVKTNYFYIQNISTDLAKVKSLYPNLAIDEGLRGKTSNWTDWNQEQDLCPEILKFGKYSGKNIQEVAEIDFNYILWIISNGRKVTREACEKLPIVVAHFEKIEADRQTKIDSWKPLVSGVQEVTFLGNPNRTVDEALLIGREHSEEGQFFSNLFSTHKHKHLAACQIEDNHTVYVFFGEVKHVDGMYPYNMAVIDGKAKKIKNKAFKLNLNIFHTDKNEWGCTQYATVIA